MKDWISSPRAQRWLRFILGGGINTGVTYALYLALNTVFGYQFSYLIAYVIGVVFAYWFNALVVFKVRLTWKGLFSYPLVYLAQYLVSALMLAGLVEFIKIPESFAPLVVVVFMVPATYVMNRVMLTGK